MGTKGYQYVCVGVDGCVCACVCACWAAYPTILSPLLGRAQSIPPVCRCHGWTSSFAYICMLSNGAAADSFQSRLSSWTPAQSCRHGYTGWAKRGAAGSRPGRSAWTRDSLRRLSVDRHQLQRPPNVTE